MAQITGPVEAGMEALKKDLAAAAAGKAWGKGGGAAALDGKTRERGAGVVTNRRERSSIGLTE
jgi:hypothetical protein